jgi:hypothetical protein
LTRLIIKASKETWQFILQSHLKFIIFNDPYVSKYSKSTDPAFFVFVGGLHEIRKTGLNNVELRQYCCSSLDSNIPYETCDLLYLVYKMIRDRTIVHWLACGIIASDLSVSCDFRSKWPDLWLPRRIIEPENAIKIISTIKEKKPEFD